MDMVRVILVDDHDIVRTGLKAYLDLQPGLEVVGEAGDGMSALLIAEELKPDVVVMDISMPEMDGIEATRRLVSICPTCKVLALTVHSDRQYFLEMLTAGAMGYVSKQAAADELLVAIRAVAAGQVYLQPDMAAWLLEEYLRLARQQPVFQVSQHEKQLPATALGVLSERELQVLMLVAEGKSNDRIGDTLGISPKTAARHRERIMNKLNIHTSVDLVRLAIRCGLVTLE